MMVSRLIAGVQALMPVWIGLAFLVVFALVIARIEHHPHDRRLWFAFLGLVAALFVFAAVVVLWLSLTTPQGDGFAELVSTRTCLRPYFTLRARLPMARSQRVGRI